MSESFSYVFIQELIDKALQATDWEEQLAEGQDSFLPMTNAEEPGQSAGYVRFWHAPEASPLDRMVHMRLLAGPAETQLLFIFGKANTTMPHFHAQAVQFPPDGCVYNADLIPRVDPIDDPEWFQTVFSPLRRHYRKAVSDRENSCAQAPANPALAVYMSPWGIASSQTTEAELNRVRPSIDAYLDHYLELATTANWDSDNPEGMRERDGHHLALFFSDELDPRAWNGVYRIVGEETGRKAKELMLKPAY